MAITDQLFSSAREQLGDVIGQPHSSAKANNFEKELKPKNFDTQDGTLSGGRWNRLLTFIVPAQETYRWGYGSSKYPENQGYLYVNFVDQADGSKVQGVVRIAQTNAQELNTMTVKEKQAEVLSGSKTDRTQMKALPEQVNKPRVGRDSKLIVDFFPDGDDPNNIDFANEQTDVILPVTAYVGQNS